MHILNSRLHSSHGGLVCLGRRPGAYLSAGRRVGTYFIDADGKQKAPTALQDDLVVMPVMLVRYKLVHVSEERMGHLLQGLRVSQISGKQF
jgi:hypothetical protein